MPRKNIPIPHIPLKFEDAVKEFLKVKPSQKCPDCEGTGKVPTRGRLKVAGKKIRYAKGERCPTCQGTGRVA